MKKQTAERFDAAMPPRGINIAQTLNTALQGPAGKSTSLYAGQVTVANGETTATVSGLDAFNGALVFITMNGNPRACTYWSGAVASGTLTITVDQDPANAAGCPLNYFLLSMSDLT